VRSKGTGDTFVTGCCAARGTNVFLQVEDPPPEARVRGAANDLSRARHAFLGDAGHSGRQRMARGVDANRRWLHWNSSPCWKSGRFDTAPRDVLAVLASDIRLAVCDRHFESVVTHSLAFRWTREPLRPKIVTAHAALANFAPAYQGQSDPLALPARGLDLRSRPRQGVDAAGQGENRFRRAGLVIPPACWDGLDRRDVGLKISAGRGMIGAESGP